MDRVYLYVGTRDSIGEAVSGVQTYTENEKQRVLGLIFSSLGVASETDEGGTEVHANDTNLKCTESGGSLTISPGYAITSGYHYINVASTDSRTFTVGVDFDYGDTIYVRNTEVLSRIKERAKGYYLDTFGPGTHYTRGEDSWALTTADPGVSGVALCIPVSDGVTTDLRKSNLLKFNHKFVDDTNIPKKDREAEYTLNVILNSGLVMKDSVSGYEFRISGITGLTGNIEFTGQQFQASVSGAHEHGTNNAFLTRVDAITDTYWPDVFSFFASGYVSSGQQYFLTDQNLRDVTTHPLFGFLQRGIINYQDGHGERQVLTRKIASTPNIPSGVTFTLIQERAPEYATVQLRDAMRAYTYKEKDKVFKLSAQAGLSAFYNDVASYSAANGYTSSSGLQGDTYIMAEASGLIAATYVSGYDDLYLGLTTSGQPLASVLSLISTTAGSYETAADAVDADLDSLGTEILDKGSRIQVRPNATINKKYHARLSWTEPVLIDNEDIMGYDVRIYKYNADATNPGDITPQQLQDNYYPDIIREQNISTPRKRLTLTSRNNGVVDADPTTTNSDDKPAWDQGLRVAITAASYASMNPSIGDYITINDETHLLVKHGIDTGIGTQRYLQFAEAYSTTPSPSDVIYCKGPSYDTSTANTSVVFPIDIDEAYIAYVRAVNEYNLASDWTTAVHQSTNYLADSAGVLLISGVQDDAEYLTQIKRIEADRLTSKFENQIVNLQRQIDAAPDAVTISNIITSLNSNSS